MTGLGSVAQSLWIWFGLILHGFHVECVVPIMDVHSAIALFPSPLFLCEIRRMPLRKRVLTGREQFFRAISCLNMSNIKVLEKVWHDLVVVISRQDCHWSRSLIWDTLCARMSLTQSSWTTSSAERHESQFVSVVDFHMVVFNCRFLQAPSWVWRCGLWQCRGSSLWCRRYVPWLLMALQSGVVCRENRKGAMAHPWGISILSSRNL